MPVATTISLISDSQDPSGQEALFPSVPHLRAWESGCSFLGVKESPSFSLASGAVFPLFLPLSFLSPSLRAPSSLRVGFEKLLSLYLSLSQKFYLFLESFLIMEYQSKKASFDFSYMSIIPLPWGT